MGSVDTERVAAIKELYAGAPWVAGCGEFANALRIAPRQPGGLLLVGTPDEEPWHFAAHLDDESRYAGLPQLMPTLVRHIVPPGAPAHLSVTLERLREARRGEALLVVAPGEPPERLLEQIADVRRHGATVLALEQGAPELLGIAHEGLDVPIGDLPTSQLSFDTAQHLVSMNAGTVPGRVGMRERLARLLDAISGPQVERL
jgi:hypothetical protein